MRSEKVAFVVVLGFSLLFPFLANAQDAGTSAVTSTTSMETYETAVVEKVAVVARESDQGEQSVDVYTVRFLSGPLQGQTKDISADESSNPNDLNPKEGDKVVILIQSDESGQLSYFIDSYDRRNAVIWLVVLFVAMLVVLAGWQGVKIATSIGISLLLIGYVLIPTFLKGVDPIPVAIGLAGVFTLISTGFSYGWNKRTIVTVIGTMGGVIVAWIVSYVFSRWTHLTGVSSDEDHLFFDKNPNLNPSGLLFAGIIIASLGVVQDVAVSIVSGVSEVKKAKPDARFGELFSSGMVVGKDHMGALANTLIFAYVGSSLSSLLLYQEFKSSWLKFINFDVVVDEIIRSLAGTIGLIFTIPITALLAAWIMRKDRTMDAKYFGHPHRH